MTDLATFFSQVQSADPGQGDQDAAKAAAARIALGLVQPGMRLGLGTGSTVEFFLQGLAERLKQGLVIQGGVPTSASTERRARELGIPLLGAPDYSSLQTDLCVDGADRVDRFGCLVKGGGGALLREKLVASHSHSVCIMVDPGKLREVLDSTFAVPVECITFGIASTKEKLASLGCQAVVRTASDGSEYRTDNGNTIVDCTFNQIPQPRSLAEQLRSVPGVVEIGLFLDLLDTLVVGLPGGSSLCWSR